MKSFAAVARILTAGVLIAFAGAGAGQQTYPNKPIRLVVPFAPGGAADILARAIADPMSKDLGKPIVISNHGGAGTIIGLEIAAKAAPDGYTLVISGDAGAINAASGLKLPYDLMRDLAPISTVYSGPQILLVNKDSPFKSVQDLVKHAKANPGRLNFGSSGIGTSVHLHSEQFNHAAGIQALHVPYKGVAPAMAELAGGRIDFVIAGSTAAIPAIKNGSLRGLALMSRERSALLPELPTAIEQGVNIETASWYGMFVTAGTPPEIVKRLHASIVKTLDSKPVQDRFLGLGGEAKAMTAEQFSAFLRHEIQSLSVLMKQLNIKLE